MFIFLKNALLRLECNPDSLPELVTHLVEHFGKFSEDEQKELLTLLTAPRNLNVCLPFLHAIQHSDRDRTTALCQSETVLELLLSHTAGCEFILQHKPFFPRILPENGWFVSGDYEPKQMTGLAVLLSANDKNINTPVATDESSEFCGSTFLAIVVSLGYLGCANYLLEIPGIDPNAAVQWSRYQGLTPLCIAINHNHLEMITRLIAHGADPNLALQFGNYADYTPIAAAALTDRVAVVKHLIETGVNWQAPLTSGKYLGQTLLETAFTANAIRVATFLMCEKGCDATTDVTSGTNAGHSLLTFAIMSGFGDLVRLVLAHNRPAVPRNFSVKQKSGHNISLLAIAIYTRNPDMVKLLLDHGFSVHTPIMGFENCMPPLFHAVSAGNVTTVQLLLDHGAATDQSYEEGPFPDTTPLFCAAIKGDAATVTLLLERGANAAWFCEKGPLQGATPLFCALKSGDFGVANALLSRGCDPRAINQAGTDKGETFISIARFYHKYFEFIRACLAHDYDCFFDIPLAKEADGLLNNNAITVNMALANLPNQHFLLQTNAQFLLSENDKMRAVLKTLSNLLDSKLRWITKQGRHHLAFPANHRHVQLLWWLLGEDQSTVLVVKSRATELLNKLDMPHALWPNKTRRVQFTTLRQTLDQFNRVLKRLGIAELRLHDEQLIIATTPRNLALLGLCLPTCRVTENRCHMPLKALSEITDFSQIEMALNRQDARLANLATRAKQVASRYTLTYTDGTAIFNFDTRAKAAEFAAQLSESHIDNTRVICSESCIADKRVQTPLPEPMPIGVEVLAAPLPQPTIDLLKAQSKREGVLERLKGMVSGNELLECQRLKHRIYDYFTAVDELIKNHHTTTLKNYRIRAKALTVQLKTLEESLGTLKRKYTELKEHVLVEETYDDIMNRCEALLRNYNELIRNDESLLKEFSTLPDVDDINPDNKPALSPANATPPEKSKDDMCESEGNHPAGKKVTAPPTVITAERPVIHQQLKVRPEDVAEALLATGRAVPSNHKNFAGMVQALPKGSRIPLFPGSASKEKRIKKTATETALTNALAHMSSLLREAQSTPTLGTRLLLRGLYYHVLTIFSALSLDKTQEFPVKIGKTLLEALSHGPWIALEGSGLLGFCQTFTDLMSLKSELRLASCTLSQEYKAGYTGTPRLYLNRIKDEIANLRLCQKALAREAKVGQEYYATLYHSIAKGCFILIGEAAARLCDTSRQFQVAIAWNALHFMTTKPNGVIDRTKLLARCTLLLDNIDCLDSLFISPTRKHALTRQLSSVITYCKRENTVLLRQALGRVSASFQALSNERSPFLDLLDMVQTLNSCRWIRNKLKHEDTSDAHADFAECGLTVETESIDVRQILRVTSTISRQHETVFFDLMESGSTLITAPRAYAPST